MCFVLKRLHSCASLYFISSCHAHFSCSMRLLAVEIPLASASKTYLGQNITDYYMIQNITLGRNAKIGEKSHTKNLDIETAYVCVCYR